jgi:hypothetical protein
MEATSKDKTLIPVIRAIKTNDFSNKQIIHQYNKIKDELSVYQDKLVLRGSRIVIPEIFRLNIVKVAHEGHLGIDKTKQLIRDRVWFLNFYLMITSFKIYF